ncbi:MAG: glycoside hydrolase family 127 protein [Oscillospiraceae bacterium]|nr:glycoside hydrolase family 127 protein [Oscillospiraceae bacterium]
MTNRKTNNTARYSESFEQFVRFVEQEQLLRTDLWERFVHQFKMDADFDGGWRGEYWGKMMRGGCLVYAYCQNPELHRVLTDSVKDMLSAQDLLGRISSYGIHHEFEAWDLWCRKYVLLGMQHYLDICRDEKLAKQILSSMCRQVDYIMSKIGSSREGKKKITLATRHWRGLNSSSILEPVMKLYGLTKEQRYLDFAAHIVGCGGTDIVNIFDLAYQDQLYPYQYPVTKAYEMISCFEGLLEYYYVTGEEKYKESILRFANKILESDFTIIGCCGCTHELFDHSTVRQANTTHQDNRMQETCVTVTLMRFFYKLFALTGDSRYVDAFETSYYNAYLGAFNTEKVIEPMLLREHPDWCIEPLPFDSYSPLTAGTRGNGIGGLKPMSDNHYYGCCACIGAAGLGMVPQMALINADDGLYLNLYLDGAVQTQTPAGKRLTVKTQTTYPVSGAVAFLLEMEQAERFVIRVRIPAWSKDTQLLVNGTPAEDKCEKGYLCLEQLWLPGTQIELRLDMRTQCLKPTPYGHQVLMNKVIWGANYMIPTYDEEDPLAKYHRALRRGPIVLAQENRLGYSVDDPVALAVSEDGYVDVQFPEKELAPYPHILEVAVPLADGSFMHMTDYASAGKLWTQESKMAAWILVQQAD